MSHWRSAFLASLLSTSAYASEPSFQDMCFQTLHPTAYAAVADGVDASPDEDSARIAGFKAETEALLAQAGLEGEVSGRRKSLYGIHKKMERKGLSLTDIDDRLALRVLVPTEADCYRVLAVLEGHFTTLPERFDDYIASPKDNGYQSLHLVVDAEGGPVEYQVRTLAMHEHAERGGAAHWRYKLQTNGPRSGQGSLLG